MINVTGRLLDWSPWEEPFRGELVADETVASAAGVVPAGAKDTPSTSAAACFTSDSHGSTKLNVCS